MNVSYYKYCSGYRKENMVMALRMKQYLAVHPSAILEII
jgi:hypothetical protein